jgi:gamma-glutamyltranspeptidase/glutathione hydrolase
MDEAGHVKGTGGIAVNIDLANTLAAVRTQGADGFYAGPVGAKIVAYSTSQGGAIATRELASYYANRTTPRVLRMGDDYVFLPESRTGAGAFAGALLDNLARAQATPAGEQDAEAAVIVAIKQTLKDFGLDSLPNDLGATGFAATDAKGQAVACAVTMNGPFGSGHTALGTGVTLAHTPSSGAVGLASAFLTPVIASPSGDRPATLAGAGAGGPNGSAAIAYALTRITHGKDIATRSELRSTGVAPYDTVNAIICTSDSCAALSDPGANGLGATVTMP